MTTLMALGDLSVHEAAESLGLSPVTVRKALREGRLRGRRIMERPGWSILVVDEASVEEYRRVHLGRHGKPSRKCLDCGHSPVRHPRSHEYRMDPRLEGR